MAVYRIDGLEGFEPKTHGKLMTEATKSSSGLIEVIVNTHFSHSRSRRPDAQRELHADTEAALQLTEKMAEKLKARNYGVKEISVFQKGDSVLNAGFTVGLTLEKEIPRLAADLSAVYAEAIAELSQPKGPQHTGNDNIFSGTLSQQRENRPWIEKVLDRLRGSRTDTSQVQKR